MHGHMNVKNSIMNTRMLSKDNESLDQCSDKHLEKEFALPRCFYEHHISVKPSSWTSRPIL